MNFSLKNFRDLQSRVGTARCAVRRKRTSQRDVPTTNMQRFMFRSPSSAPGTAFTLIELLVVIAIIGLLAALVVGGARLANIARAKSRVTTERDALITAIQRYQKAKGYYPPDNPNDPACVQTPLFYELTGTTMNPGKSPPTFQSLVTGEVLGTNQIGPLFGTLGFLNSSADPTTPAINFYTGVKSQQYLLVPGSGGNNFTVMGVPISGPLNMSPAPGAVAAVKYINPWHYNYSHPTNNHDSFDLWMDVQYGGRTNRISNWSADPQPL